MTTLTCPEEAGSDAVLALWCRRPGEAVHTGEVLAILEEEDHLGTLVADIDGVIDHLLVQGGEHVHADEPLATVRES